MNAWRWIEEGRIEERTEPVGRALPQAWVRLSPVVNGICATDFELVAGRLEGMAGAPPIIPGHEIVAKVVESSHPDIPKGVVVVVNTILGCGMCRHCRNQRSQLCASAKEMGLSADGGWQEELLAPGANCYILPTRISPTVGVFVEPLSCQLGAVQALAISTDDRVLVSGSGVAALLYVALVREHDPETLVVAVNDPARGELGLSLGADSYIDIGADQLPDSAFSKAIDAVGTTTALKQSVNASDRGGHLALYGLADAEPTVPLRDVITKNLTLTGHTSAPWLWAPATEFVARRGYELAQLVTDRIPFTDVGTRFPALAAHGYRGPHIKAVIDHASDI